MNTELLKLDASTLRSLLIKETKKFLHALEHGSSVSDLEEIRLTIREIAAILEKKEKGSNSAAA